MESTECKQAPPLHTICSGEREGVVLQEDKHPEQPASRFSTNTAQINIVVAFVRRECEANNVCVGLLLRYLKEHKNQ